MKTPISLGQRIQKSVTGLATEALPAARFVTYVGTEFNGPYGVATPSTILGINPDLMTFPEALNVELPGVGGAGGRSAGVNYYDVLTGQAATIVTCADAVGVEVADESVFTAIDMPVAIDAEGKAVLADEGDVIVGYTRSLPRAGFGYVDQDGNPGEGTIGMFPFDGTQGPADTTYYVLVTLSDAGVTVPVTP
jgi:hypothetical protein